jgi:hypothetical protein
MAPKNSKGQQKVCAVSKQAKSNPLASVVRLIVVDTSYLLELFQVPDCSSDRAYGPICQLFENARHITDQLQVPLPVLFELGNHVADVKNGESRKRLAAELIDAVNDWLSGETPLTIVSSMNDARTVQDFRDAVTGLTQEFRTLAPDRQGLTNAAIALEAKKLRQKHKNSSLKTYLVHIWTTDKKLKALEPDAEANAFVGV